MIKEPLFTIVMCCWALGAVGWFVMSVRMEMELRRLRIIRAALEFERTRAKIYSDFLEHVSSGGTYQTAYLRGSSAEVTGDGN